MAATNMEGRDRRTDSLLRGKVDEVQGISLRGAPRTLLVDRQALRSSGGDVPPSLQAKLGALTRDEEMRLVVLSAAGDDRPDSLGDAPHLDASSIGEAQPDPPILAILSEQLPLPPHVCAWYVGAGSAGPPFHATRRAGVEATCEILALLGTALVQERAGIAFRAAGAGEPIPREAPFDPGIVDGIVTAVSGHPRRVERLERRGGQGEHNLDKEMERLIAATLPPILASQDRSGAVAAAPPPHGPDEPNYWFFWQRDAGQVVLAMVQLARDSVDEHLRDSARTFVARYVDFVERLPRGVETADLGVSRFAMSGKPIKSYGSPQKDGPAHTVLAVAAALGRSARAYAVSQPYLEYLDRHIDGPSFDPWEFAVGDIFFDYNLARRALRAGAKLAGAQGDGSAAARYESRAQQLQSALQAFKSPEKGYVLAGRRFLQPFIRTISHLDVGVVGSVLTAYDLEDPFLNVEDPLIEGTMQKLEGFCAERWPVNVAWLRRGRSGMGMGRFPEDTNDGIGSTGGNPWTFATLWAAQYYLRLVQRRDALGAEDAGSRRADLLERADGYLQFVLSHLPADALTEQIDGQEGTPRGARKLAWAQAALIGTLLLRQEVRKSSAGRDEMKEGKTE